MVWESGRLTVDVLRARALRPAKKGGTCDAFVSVSLVNADGSVLESQPKTARKTAVVKQTLNPEWSSKTERFIFDDVRGPTLPVLRLEVVHFNRFAKSLPLGRADYPLSVIEEHGIDREPEWLPLESGDATGEIEVQVTLRPGTGDAREDALAEALVTRWFAKKNEEDDDEENVGKHPNVVRFALIQARALRVGKKGWFAGDYSEGTSNPYVTLQMGSSSYRSPACTKTVEPIWMDSGSLELQENQKFLTVRVEDEADNVVMKAGGLSNRFLGGVQIDLEAMIPALEEDDLSAPPEWFVLMNEADLMGVANEDEADCGEIELALKLAYDPAFDPSEDRPFFAEALDEECYTRAPNELRVAVCRGRDLPAMDVAIDIPYMRSEASSDPYVTLSLKNGKKVKTKVKKKTLKPVWNEVFSLELLGGETSLDLTVFDYDLIGADDFMGKVSIPVTYKQQGEVTRAWYGLDTADGGEILVVAQTRFNRSYHYAPFVEGAYSFQEEPNEFRLAVFRVRGLLTDEQEGLAARAKRLAKKEAVVVVVGAPLVQLQFTVEGQQRPAPWLSTGKDLEDDIIFKETYSRPFTQRTLRLQVSLRRTTANDQNHDDDEVVGECVVEVGRFSKELVRGWYELSPSKTSVYIIAQCWYNPALYYEPFEESYSEEWPNELLVALSRGRDLGGSNNKEQLSCSFSIGGRDVYTSGLASAGSQPTWHEEFAVECHAAAASLRVCVWKQQQGKKKSVFLGEFQVDNVSTTMLPRQWHAVAGQSGDLGDVELVMQWRYNSVYDGDLAAQQKAAEARALEEARLRLEADRLAALQLLADEEAARILFEAEQEAGRLRLLKEAADELARRRPPWHGGVSLRAFDDSIYEAAATGKAIPLLRAYLEAQKAQGHLRSALEERGSRRGRALLHEAAQCESDTVLRMLVEVYGAKVEVTTLFGRDTPLHLASLSSRRRNVFLLVSSYGAQADARNKYKANPLHYATTLSVVRNLIRGGARADALDASGRSPLKAAEEADAPFNVLKELGDIGLAHSRAAFAESLGAEREKSLACAAASEAELRRKNQEKLLSFDGQLRADYERWRSGEVSGAKIHDLRRRRLAMETRWDDMVANKGPRDEAKLALTYDGGAFNLASLGKGLKSGLFPKNQSKATRDIMRRKMVTGTIAKQIAHSESLPRVPSPDR